VPDGCGGNTTCGSCALGEDCSPAHRCTKTTITLYDPEGNLVGEYDKAGAPVYEVAYIDELPLARMTPSAIQTIEADQLGTPRALVDANGKIVWRWDGDAFGASPPDEDPDGDSVKTSFPMRLPGQLYDEESGLHYNYFRDYDPTVGRYVKADPIGLAGGLNAYAYASAQPLALVDPFGLADGQASDMMWQAQANKRIAAHCYGEGNCNDGSSRPPAPTEGSSSTPGRTQDEAQAALIKAAIKRAVPARRVGGMTCQQASIDGWRTATGKPNGMPDKDTLKQIMAGVTEAENKARRK
jgi:RHS repeat-associated protein